ncbi:MAG: BON domain-containing protein [Burkholderiales bacterium]|nr:BON domain-containing protein [Burkholderiales bacterium]
MQGARFVAALGLAAALMALGGCAAVVVGGAAAGTALVATDRRSTGVQVEDEAIERRIGAALGRQFAQGSVNITAVSYNLRVVLVGQVPTEMARVEAERIARETQNVRAVVNELTIGMIAGTASLANDAGITALVRTTLTTTEGVPSGTIKVVTERNVVYLMGLVTPAEGETAARAASRVNGVQRVVKVFETVTAAPAAEPTKK